MDELKLQSLINMSRRYLDDRLRNSEKKRVDEVSKTLFYQTLHDDSPDSELNKAIRLFAVMARHSTKTAPISDKKTEDLKVMTEYMQNTLLECLFSKPPALSLVENH